MATLAMARTEFRVPCRCVIGQSTLSDLRLKSQRSSSEHATLGWHSGHWVLRDLGSSNGTSVGTTLLSPRDRVLLSAGDELRFGDDDEVWIVVDVSPPDPCAVLLGPQRVLWGEAGLLLIPSVDAPEGSIFVENGRWRLDAGGEQSLPECGGVVQLESGYWRLLLPENPMEPPAATVGYELDLGELELSFKVSAEQLALTLIQGKLKTELPARACLYTLVALARLRLEAGDHADAGWVSSFDLAALRRSSPEKIAVDVHRLRKLFQEAGVRNAAGIIERDGAKRIRIGVGRLREARD